MLDEALKRKARDYADRIISLEEEKAKLASDIAGEYEGAEADGLDKDALKEAVRRRRKMNKEGAAQYRLFLGMADQYFEAVCALTDANAA